MQLQGWLIFAIGFLAQTFFTLRTLVQWIKSEKSHRSVSPTAYWVLSVLGAYTMFFYGVLRNDFSIVLGQFISYYVYLWNLNAKGLWKKMSLLLKAVLLITPVIAAILLIRDAQRYITGFFCNDDIPLWLVIYGSLGQILFTLRFVYQWAYSKIKGESFLPIVFWIISLVGSGSIIGYAIIRKDPVLILGQAFGFVVYARNLMLCLGQKESEGKYEN